MRLGQIARRLGVTPAEIVRYLSDVNITVEESTNAKLDDAHIPLLYARFAPAETIDTAAREQQTTMSTDDTYGEASRSTTTPLAETPQATEPLPGTEESDLIRAPKIELSGLKVLGKIELPEPKKKDAPLPRQGDDTGGEQKENYHTDRKKQSRGQRPYKNPIVVQREREMHEEQERRKEKAAQEKERRTQNYHNRVNLSPPTKAVRLVDEPLEELNTSTADEQPTSWFGKLLRWLRT
jgi:hypothetical protein